MSDKPKINKVRFVNYMIMQQITILWAWLFRKFFKHQYDDFVKNLNMVTERSKDLADYKEMVLALYACNKMSQVNQAKKRYVNTFTKMRQSIIGNYKHENLKEYELHVEIEKLNERIDRL